MWLCARTWGITQCSMVEITKLIFLTLFRLLYWKSGVIMQSKLLLESNLQVAVKSPGQTFEVACCLWCTMLGFQQKHSDICLSIKTYSSLTAFNKTTVLYTAVKYVQCEKIWKYLSPVTHVQRHTFHSTAITYTADENNTCCNKKCNDGQYERY